APRRRRRRAERARGLVGARRRTAPARARGAARRAPRRDRARRGAAEGARQRGQRRAAHRHARAAPDRAAPAGAPGGAARPRGSGGPASGAAMLPGPSPAPVSVLAGGVGAARFLRGLVRALPPQEITAIVNTGDDRSFYGLHVSPDLDIVTYTLAGRIDAERGWGLAGDGFAVIEALGRLGHETWFRLGDRDLATCLHRTLALR